MNQYHSLPCMGLLSILPPTSGGCLAVEVVSQGNNRSNPDAHRKTAVGIKIIQLGVRFLIQSQRYLR